VLSILAEMCINIYYKMLDSNFDPCTHVHRISVSHGKYYVAMSHIQISLTFSDPFPRVALINYRLYAPPIHQ